MSEQPSRRSSSYLMSDVLDNVRVALSFAFLGVILLVTLVAVTASTLILRVENKLRGRVVLEMHGESQEPQAGTPLR
jgi:hypothetical protein